MVFLTHHVFDCVLCLLHFVIRHKEVDDANVVLLLSQHLLEVGCLEEGGRGGIQGATVCQECAASVGISTRHCGSQLVNTWPVPNLPP